MSGMNFAALPHWSPATLAPCDAYALEAIGLLQTYRGKRFHGDRLGERQSAKKRLDR
jgi:hypothetical protein